MLHLLKKSVEGRKEKRESPTSSATAMLINKLNLPSFSEFNQFDDDIRKLIISFAAEAPFEQKLGRYHQDSLTSTLPLVNKEFKHFALLDYFWEPALKRQLMNKDHGMLWKEGLRRLLPPDENIDDEELVSLTRVLQVISDYFGYNMGCKEIYKKVLTTHICFDAPIFLMPCQLQIGEIYGLHLFEPRYRLMIHELLLGCENPAEASNGGKIRIGRRNGVRTPPLLIHACLGRVAPGEFACLVQLVWCCTYEGGTADVRLLPVAWVQFDRIWIRRNAHHLYYAKAWRMPGNASLDDDNE